MRNFFIIFLFLFLSHCGYTAVYKGIEKQDIRISITSMQGDTQLNNLVKNQLAKYSKNDSDKIYNLIINTEYEKIILSKDKTGKATNLNLSATVNFKINFNQKNYNLTFNESLNIENSSDSYEQRNYENIIKNNFIQSIVNKLTARLGYLN
tara:strand:+ start:49 stop:501 length:453 start_codon:yes stop_codon:yes gene_type:complete